MRGEGGERLLDALLVADIRVNMLEQADLRLLVCRDVQAGSRHQAQKPQRLERHGFAARVWAGDDQRVVVVADGDVDRHGLVLVEQRVPRAQQAAAARALHEHRRRGVHLKRQLGAREDEVERDERVVILLDCIFIQCDLVRQLSQNALDLGLLAALEHLDLVVDLHDLLWLDEHGRAGGRGIVHEARDVAAVLGLDRHNVTPVALGDDGLLQILGPLARDQAVQGLAHLARDAPQLAADGQQLGACAVRDLLLRDDRGRDRFLERPVAGKQAEDRRERGLFLVLRVVHQRAARGLQQARHVEQLARVERAAARGAHQRRPHLPDAAEARAAPPDHQVLRVGRLIHPDLRLLMVVQRPQGAAFLLRRFGRGLRRKAVENLVIFQCF